MCPKPSSFSQPPAASLTRTAEIGIQPARDPFAGDENVGLDAVLADGPQLAGSHEPGLHLVGDVERAVALAQLLDALEVAGVREREAVGGRDRLHDHRGHVAAPQGLLHRRQVVERDVGELLGAIRQEERGEAVVTGRHCQSRMAVVGLDDRDDLALLGRVPGGLERDVDRLAPTAAVDDLADVGRCGLDERLGERRTGEGREVMVPDVEVLHGSCHRLHDLGIAMPEVVGPSVQVDVDEPLARDVVDEVVLPPVDDERHPGVDPELASCPGSRTPSTWRASRSWRRRRSSERSREASSGDGPG